MIITVETNDDSGFVQILRRELSEMRSVAGAINHASLPTAAQLTILTPTGRLTTLTISPCAPFLPITINS